MKALTLLIVLPLSLSLALAVPREMITLVEEPIDISPRKKGTQLKAFSIPEETGAIIEGEGIVSFLLLEKDTKTGKTAYSFRSYSQQFKHEVQGDGTLFERYYINPAAKCSDLIHAAAA